MTDFIWRISTLQKIPTMLVSTVSGFGQSPEYRELREYELSIPGVVCGAFARYLGRIYAEGQSEQSRLAVESAHEAIEALASAPETAVRCLVTDEIFENLEVEPAVRELIKSHLKPNALALYERFIKEAEE
jgi:hypothetical protein